MNGPFAMDGPSGYPTSASERTRWILGRRPDLDESRRHLPTDRPSAWLEEIEPDENLRPATVLTLFLTNPECPWRCLMCDLWKHTLPRSMRLPPGAVVKQVESVLSAWNTRGAAGSGDRHIKLYNAGSFFDRGAIPPEDHAAIARLCEGFSRVIVECHPALVDEAVLRFRDQLKPGTTLEVAMGLETAHPEILERLNKGVSLDGFQQAAGFLRREGVAQRTFVLVKPPFMSEEDAADWAVRSTSFAFDTGSSVVALIPTRLGNGALEALVATGEFAPPRFATFQEAFRRSLALRRGRVFADLWDLERFCTGVDDSATEKSRLHAANLTQQWPDQEALGRPTR